MSVLPVGIGSSGGYEISRSVRFRSSATAYFNRTPSVSGSTTSWTISAWVKMGLPSQGQFFAAGSGQGNGVATERLSFNDTMYWQRAVIQTSNVYDYSPTQKFRDYSAWQHIMYVWDSSNATSTQRQRYFINGVQVTSLSGTQCGLNQNSIVNSVINHRIGVSYDTTTSYGDFYLAEFYFIDGQSLSSSSFGEYDSITGVWKPKKYTGTYGTNGAYLNFSDNSAATAAAIGKDYSGNGNNWTPNNISLTAGATYDSMLDVPTPYADGGNGRGNYATWNPINNSTTNSYTFSNGNLGATVSTTSGGRGITSTSGMTSSSGVKYYAELTVSAWGGSSNADVGVLNTNTSVMTTSSFAASGCIGSYLSNGYSINKGGNVVNNGTTLATGLTTFADGDIVQIAYDGTYIYFGKNGTWLNSAVPASGTGGYSVAAGTYAFAFGVTSNTSQTGTVIGNFGQRPFSYTPPSGFKALNTQNLPTPTIANGASYMAATTYTGTGATQSISNTVNGVSFQPDFVWIKQRSTIRDHRLNDSVRGVNKQLYSNTTGAETSNTDELTTFNSNGFTLSTSAGVNASAGTYVAWQWNAGGSTVTNTSGTISSQVRANPTAGFSVVTYTGTGVSNATVGHGLGVTPSMIILKDRDTNTNNNNWIVWHSSLSANNNLYLSSTDAQSAYTSTSYGGIGTSPTSSVFTLGNGTVSNATPNENGDRYVAYCFAAVAGYSAFGSYTGNGSTDGPFVFTGFRPRFVLVKAITAASAENWSILDTARSPVNVMDDVLWPNVSTAEQTNAINNCDFTSNGFKFRTTDARWNNSSYTYIYMAFAENPFKYSLAR